MMLQEVMNILLRRRAWKNIKRALAATIVIMLISSCASIKRIIPIEEITPEDVDPKVSFIDTQEVEVESSSIEAVEPEIVIASYERLLERGNPQIRKEALHRLADLTMRLAEAKLGNEGRESEMSEAMRNATFAKAVAYYQTLLLEFPEYPAADEVKYQLARAHSLNSDPESSLAILDQLAVVHAESVSYVESQFRRGEAYFARKKYQTAEVAYTEVLNKGANTEFYDKALYKRGWSLFKQSLFDLAQNDFFELYKRLQVQSVAAGGNNRLINDLLSDTRRVISLGFYNQDGVASVTQYFATKGAEPFENEIYGELATLYIDQERFQDAADTYQGFIKRNPVSLHAPDFHSRMIDVYRSGGFPSLILPAKESFVVNYGRTSPFWQKYSGKTIEDLKPLLRVHLDDISKFYHAEAQKSKKPADYLVAAKWYREILATFEDPAIDSKYRFSLAEALSDGGQLELSAKEYEIVAYTNPASEFSRDAGYRALVAYQNIQYPKEATQLEKLLPSIQSGLKFSTTFAQDTKAPEILSRVAEQQLMIDNVQGAVDASRQLLVMPAQPTQVQKDRARIIIANGLFDLKQYADAETAITDLLRNGKLTNKQRLNFRQRRVESIYQLAEAAKLAKQDQVAIDLFLKVKQLEPKLPIAINAHFDAATLLLTTNQLTEAAKLFESFRKTYPKHKLSADIPERLALIYEKEENWSKAAVEFSRLAKAQTDPELAREGQWRVAELWEKAGNKKQAIQTYKDYVWTYPAPYLLAQEGRYKLVNMYIETNDPVKSNFWRQKIIEFYAKNSKSNNTRTAFMAAESKFTLSETLFNQFKRIKLRLPLAPNLKKKRAAMKKALGSYNAVAGFGVAQFTTASTHKVALIYQILSDDLMSSQRPKGLSEDEAEEYGFLLEDQALPFEDKAISFFEVNAKRTAENIYDDSVKSSIDSLRKLKPVQYDKDESLEALNEVSF